jgi:hypothetical protein
VRLMDCTGHEISLHGLALRHYYMVQFAT